MPVVVVENKGLLIPDEMTNRFNHVQCQPKILGHILTTLDISRFNLELYLIRLDKEKTEIHELSRGSPYVSSLRASYEDGCIFCVPGPLCGEFTGHR